jgi:hypothetical protein
MLTEQEIRTRLRSLLVQSLSLAEMRVLCSNAGVPLSGQEQNLESLVFAFVDYAYTQDMFPEMIRFLRYRRPDIDLSWTDMQLGRYVLEKLVFLLYGQFSIKELQNLLFEVDVDYILPRGVSRMENIKNVVDILNNANKIHILIQIIRVKYPDVDISSILLLPGDNDKEGSTYLPIDEPVELVAEAKLILVGDGNVGKTSLVNRLVYNSFNPSENTTRGVAITRWRLELPHPDVKEARINIWDFGGQGSMHATHPYFFSQRAVYLVTLNVREETHFGRIEYWLRLIRIYGAESPVIISLLLS